MSKDGSKKYREFPFRLFKWFCDPDIHLDIEGDLIELYKRRIQQENTRKAKLLLYKDVLLLFRPGIIRPISFLQINRQKIMLKYHLKMALRTFNRYRTSFTINIIGLSTALTCALFIYIWVMDEWKINRFHANDQQLYQVIRTNTNQKGIQTTTSTPALLTAAIKKDIPEVEYATTINNFDIGSRTRGILSHEDKQLQVKGLFASTDFFQVFSYPLLAGSPEKVLTEPNAIVITKDLALDFFGSLDNVIGKTLSAKRNIYGLDYTITGIVDNPPSYSTQQFEFVINYETVFKNDTWLLEWGGDGAQTFIVLKKGSDQKLIEDKLNQLITSKPDREGNGLFLQKFSDVYLWGRYEDGAIVGGRISYVRLFSIISILIIILAAINFINLSTAQAARKMKQIGVQKSMGVQRSNLIAQYLSESVLLCLFSFAIALILSATLLPQISALSGKELSLQLGWRFWLTIGLFVIALGFLAGIYPAIYLSKLSTMNCLKGKIVNSLSELWMRRGMVSMQFSVSIVFIIGFLILNQQINYINKLDLGYNRDHVINFNLGGQYNRKTLITELEQIPGVLKASNIAGGNIVNNQGAGGGFSWSGNVSDEDIIFNRPHIGYQFFETLDIEILEGRSFSSEFQNETEKLIINEAAAEIIGDPDIVGKVIMDGDNPKEVIGIAKNFKIRSLHE
ncbi:MAG: ABC transporter permease, partial [Bacteroidota bacterium]